MFAYDLAAHLGESDVRGMLKRMSVRELAEWIAYHRLNPFGEYRADRRAAMICAVLVDLHNAMGKSRKSPTPLDTFMVNFQDDYNKNNPGTAGLTDKRVPAKQGLDTVEGARSGIAMMKAIYGSDGRKRESNPRLGRVIIPDVEES